jgi:hypothetical protein
MPFFTIVSDRNDSRSGSFALLTVPQVTSSRTAQPHRSDSPDTITLRAFPVRFITRALYRFSCRHTRPMTCEGSDENRHSAGAPAWVATSASGKYSGKTSAPSEETGPPGPHRSPMVTLAAFLPTRQPQTAYSACRRNHRLFRAERGFYAAVR